jgi:acetoin utilization deacetylase AcuC-like enzyme
MKVVTHEDFKKVYTHEPAAAPGRIEAILKAISDEVVFEEAYPAGAEDISSIHTKSHIQSVTHQGLYNISCLAAGAAIQTALIGLKEPCFGLIRPPGHHASADSYWGFCYFNNMAVALDHLKRNGHIKTAYVLDFDMHYGDGTVNILKPRGYVAIHNPDTHDRKEYLEEVSRHLQSAAADIFAVSAGFDNHLHDWGGVLLTEDYHAMGRMVHDTAKRLQAGCFGLLEGGYNHTVLGENVQAFLRGLSGL